MTEDTANTSPQPSHTEQVTPSPEKPDAIVAKARLDYESELSCAIEEVDLILSYLCRKGMKIPPDIIQDILNTKQAFTENGKVSVTEESRFWQCYCALAEQIKPATLTSVKETAPSGFWQKQHKGHYKRVKRVPVYYGIAICILILLTMMMQSYYMIGLDVLNKSDKLYQAQADLQQQISQLTSQPQDTLSGEQKEQLKNLIREEKESGQKFDSNRIFLDQWNAVWRLGIQPQIRFSEYDDYIYHKKLSTAQKQLEQLKTQERTRQITRKIVRYQKVVDQLTSERQLQISNYLFFGARISAGHMIDLLEGYILPLLLGSLGAFTLVLRSIYQSFKEETFTVKSCLDYNLRILLGSVMGISSGMIFNKEQTVIDAEYSPMLIAFLIGYNVEILFSLMDNLARRLSQTDVSGKRMS
ncbi:hypothetical protein [Vibrio aerogenes]|nr:hypothetical protein [Vibrio aerogenes]